MHQYKVIEDREPDEKKYVQVSSRGVNSPGLQDGKKSTPNLVTRHNSILEVDQEQQNLVENRPKSLTQGPSCDSPLPNHCKVSKAPELVSAKASSSYPEKLDEPELKYGNENTLYDAEDEESNLLFDWNLPRIVTIRSGSSSQNEITKTSIVESKIGLKSEAQDKILTKKRIRTLADAFFTVVVVSPMVVAHWRGHWILMDIYLAKFSTWGCFLLGIGLHATFAVLRNHLHAKFVDKFREKSALARTGYCLFRIMYTYLFSAACVLQWRGGWIIFDESTGHKWVRESVTLACVLILARLRCIRNLLASPFVLIIDKRAYMFDFSTRYNMNSRDWTLYILDCAFSVGIVGTLVVFVWRGVWVSLDLYLFPDNQEYSAVGSVVIGYTVVVITFLLQPLMRWACAQLEGFPRLIVADLFMLLSFAGTVNVWRGVWNVLGLWFLPENIELSCWITHLGCFTFLVLLNCSNSILVRGVLIDAEEAEGKCVVFPCHYLRLFFKIEREKKEARRQNLVVASRDLATIMEHPGKEGNGTVLSSPKSPTVIESPESPV